MSGRAREVLAVAVQQEIARRREGAHKNPRVELAAIREAVQVLAP